MTRNLVEDDVPLEERTKANPAEQTPLAPKRHRWVRGLALGTAVVALAAGVAAWQFPRARSAAIAAVERLVEHKPAVAAAPRPPIVRTALVAAASGREARFTGVIHARYESALGFRVAGKIVERLVDTGERVHKDQPLMRLDPTDLALALRAARSEVDSARAAAAQTAADEVRQRVLVAKDQTPRQVYDRDKAAADSAAAKLTSAIAQERQAENQASYAVLLADADGIIMETSGEPGQVVSAGQPVVRLARDGPREAEVYLPEGETAAPAGSATLYADHQISFPAKLREISSSADPATRTFRARYTLAGEGKDAPLGATVTVRMPRPNDEPAGVVVPAAALYDDGNGPKVWVVDHASSKVAARTVRILKIGEENADVAGDIQAGERVVALGAHLLEAGEKVAIDRTPTDRSVR